MKRKHGIAVSVVAAVAVVLIALYATGTIPVLAKGNIIVTLIDEETGKRVGRVNGGYHQGLSWMALIKAMVNCALKG